MSGHPAARQRVLIVGGGISGLSCAFYLSRALDPAQTEIVLLEASSRWGGLIQTERSGGYVLEAGPDSFLSQKPETLELCRELGLASRLIHSRHSQVYLFCGGRLQPLPRDLLFSLPVDRGVLLRDPLLSWKGRLRAALEPLIPGGRLEDESVADFVERRFGSEVLEKLAEPLVAGIFGGDARCLSIRSVLPHLYEAEKTSGKVSAKRPAKKVSSQRVEGGGGENSFLSLTSGMAELVDALLVNLKGSVTLYSSTPAVEITPGSGGFLVRTPEAEFSAGDIVLATPAYVSAALLKGWHPELAENLRDIPYASSLIVSLAYPGEVAGKRMGSGFLVSGKDRKNLLACTWVWRKFSGRCPPGKSLLRCFVPSSGLPVSVEDADLLATIRRELEEILGIREAPILERVYRWEGAMPQYTVGHSMRQRGISRALEGWPGLHLVGNFLDGVGISDCIRHARQAVRRIAARH